MNTVFFTWNLTSVFPQHLCVRVGAKAVSVVPHKNFGSHFTAIKRDEGVSVCYCVCVSLYVGVGVHEKQGSTLDQTKVVCVCVYVCVCTVVTHGFLLLSGGSRLYHR